MAIINEVNEDKPRKEVVVSVQPQSEGEESDADEEVEESNEEGKINNPPSSFIKLISM